MISREIKTIKGNDFFSENIYRILHNPCYKVLWRIHPKRDGKNMYIVRQTGTAILTVISIIRY